MKVIALARATVVSRASLSPVMNGRMANAWAYKALLYLSIASMYVHTHTIPYPSTYVQMLIFIFF